MQDQSFIISFQGGDHTAYKELYNRYYKNIYQFSLKITRDHFEAEDIAIKTLHKLIERRHTYRSTTEITAESIVIARNSSIDYQRKERLKKAYLKKMPNDSAIHLMHELNEFPSSIKVSFTILSYKQRIAIYLRYEKNLTYKEAGKILNVNGKSVEKLIQRAILKLRQDVKK